MTNIKNIFSKNKSKNKSNIKNKIKYNSKDDVVEIKTPKHIPKLKINLPPIISSIGILREKSVRKTYTPTLLSVTGLYLSNKLIKKKTNGDKENLRNNNEKLQMTGIIAMMLAGYSTMNNNNGDDYQTLPNPLA